MLVLKIFETDFELFYLGPKLTAFELTNYEKL